MKLHLFPRLLIVSVFILSSTFKIVVAQREKNIGWRAGVSTTVITPKQPVWMAGYANRDRPSEGTLVDLWAKALVLQDEQGKKVVLITADLVGIPKKLSNRIRDALATRFQLKRADILINTSHTHSGPVLTDALVDIYPMNSEQKSDVDRYSNQLADQIVKLTADAIGSLQPAQVYAGNGVTRFQVNRRNNTETLLSTLTELQGPNDFAVPVIKVLNSTGKLIAVAFGYACHNTVLSGYKFSGDYAGFAQIELEKAYPGVAALFLQGCGANQNPLPRRTVALAQQYGQELAASVRRVLNEEMRVLKPVLTTAYSEINLPLNAPPTKEELTKKAAQAPEVYQKRWAERLLKKIEAGEPLMTSYPYPVEVWQLGDQPIIALGGEVVVEYANELKKIFGHEIFVLGYSNDVMAYIPNATIIREGGYEGASSQMVYGLPNTWKINIETLIIQEVLQLAKKVGVSIPESKIN